MSESSTTGAADLAHFDADARAEALTVPTLTIGGLRYRGRILSATEWLPWYERYLALAKRDGKDGTVIRERLAFYRAYLAVVFPRRTLKFWAPDPAALLERHPGNALAEAFTDFFFLQLSAIAGAEESVPAETLEQAPPPSPALGNISPGLVPPASVDAPPSAPSA